MLADATSQPIDFVSDNGAEFLGVFSQQLDRVDIPRSASTAHKSASTARRPPRPAISSPTAPCWGSTSGPPPSCMLIEGCDVVISSDVTFAADAMQPVTGPVDCPDTTHGEPPCWLRSRCPTTRVATPPAPPNGAAGAGRTATAVSDSATSHSAPPATAPPAAASPGGTSTDGSGGDLPDAMAPHCSSALTLAAAAKSDLPGARGIVHRPPGPASLGAFLGGLLPMGPWGKLSAVRLGFLKPEQSRSGTCRVGQIARLPQARCNTNCRQTGAGVGGPRSRAQRTTSLAPAPCRGLHALLLSSAPVHASMADIHPVPAR